LRFELHYVLELADDLAGQERFDLIVDSHCLHCLIYDTDRARFFDNVRRLLQPSGAFVVETMARHARVDFGADFVLDDDGVLWRKYADGDPADTRILRGEPHHPNRRVRAPDELEAEVKAAGFAVDFVRASEQQESPGDPLNWQAILRLPMVCS
jgi:SAM-dependent methyltransferase